MLWVADADRFWPLVEQGAKHIPADVDLAALREKVRQGDCRMLIDPPHIGFLIVQLYMRPQRHLFVWLGWSGDREAAIDLYVPELMAMARQVGAEYLLMRSRRKGFQRKGWTIDRIDTDGIKYRKDL